MMRLRRTGLAAITLLLACSCLAAARTDMPSGLPEVATGSGDMAARMRSLLQIELTVANDNYTYPNVTVDVGIFHPQGCTPWWTRTIPAGSTVCPKACQISGFKQGYDSIQLAPLLIRLEKGATSRVAPRPLKGAFLNVTGTSRLPNRRDFVAQSSSSFGLQFVDFTGNYDVGAHFTAAIGLVKKDPAADGQAVADPKAKHTPYCFFNVTWTIVPAGSIAQAPAAAKAAAAPAPAPLPAGAAATTRPAAAAPSEVFDSNGF